MRASTHLRILDASDLPGGSQASIVQVQQGRLQPAASALANGATNRFCFHPILGTSLVGPSVSSSAPAMTTTTACRTFAAPFTLVDVPAICWGQRHPGADGEVAASHLLIAFVIDFVLRFCRDYPDLVATASDGGDGQIGLMFRYKSDADLAVSALLGKLSGIPSNLPMGPCSL